MKIITFLSLLFFIPEAFSASVFISKAKWNKTSFSVCFIHDAKFLNSIDDRVRIPWTKEDKVVGKKTKSFRVPLKREEIIPFPNDYMSAITEAIKKSYAPIGFKFTFQSFCSNRNLADIVFYYSNNEDLGTFAA